MYKVSVIIPTYNCAHFLSDCFDSLVNQTMKDFEIIVIDDASTDNTPEIVSSYVSIFGERLIYKKLEQNVGRGGVRNYGLEIARGEYITFLDADDVYCSDKIEIQSQYLDNNSDVCGVSCKYYSVDKNLKNPVLFDGWAHDYKILFGDRYAKFNDATVAIMIRSYVIKKIGLFDKNLIRNEDTDFVIRLIQFGRVGFIDRPLFYYRLYETNLWSITGLRERAKGNVVLYKKIIRNMDNNRNVKEFAHVRLANSVYLFRELRYFEPMLIWFYYLYKFNISLPLWKWTLVGLKVVVGYRLTQSLKKIILNMLDSK